MLSDQEPQAPVAVKRPTQSLAQVSDQKLRPIPVSGWHPSLKEVDR